MASRLVPTDGHIDLRATLGPMLRGMRDPTMRAARAAVERASRTPEGAVAVRFTSVEGGVHVEGWGPGSSWMLERAPAWVGALDDETGFDPPSGIVRELWRRRRGMRIPRTDLVVERLIPVVLEQKVTWTEARRAYERLTTALAEPAPGPLGLTLPPEPARVAELPYHAFHPFGVERRRADVLRRVCARAPWIDASADLPRPEASARLRSLPGIGPWSVAEVGRTALGDADAVSVGDYHLKHQVSWFLAHEPRGTDERMLELLEPFRPHRGRVQRLIESSGIGAPAFGPRREPASIERL